MSVFFNTKLFALSIGGALFLHSGSVRAQESSTSSAEKGQASTSDPQSPDNDVKAPVQVPPELEVRPMGSSLPLPTYDTRLRWGSLFVRSVELMHNYSQFQGVTAAGTQGIFDQSSFNATVLRPDFIFDRYLRHSRLVLEYAPLLEAVNGKFSSNFANQTASLEWVQELTPRLTLGLSDYFRYYSVRDLYSYYVNADAFRNTIVTGSLVPSSFLDGGGSWLNESVQASFAYALSPTSSISVAPEFGYNHITGQLNGPATTDGSQYGVSAAWNKQISRHSAIHVSYRYQILRESGADTSYQYAQAGYSRSFGTGTSFSVSAGLETADFVSGRQWNVTTSVQASQKIGRGSASVSYSRGTPLFSELGSTGLSQMVFGEFRYNFTRRWYATVQGGYENSLTSSIIDVSGKYASAEVGYQLTSQLSCFTRYAYKTQDGGDPNLLVGNRYYYAGGIRWSAREVQ